MPQPRKKAPPTLKLLTPRQRMIITMLATLKRLRVAAQQNLQVLVLARMRVKIVPLVHPVLAAAAARRDKVLFVLGLDEHGAGLGGWVLFEVRAD